MHKLKKSTKKGKKIIKARNHTDFCSLYWGNGKKREKVSKIVTYLKKNEHFYILGGAPPPQKKITFGNPQPFQAKNL